MMVTSITNDTQKDKCNTLHPPLIHAIQVDLICHVGVLENHIIKLILVPGLCMKSECPCHLLTTENITFTHSKKNHVQMK